MNLRPYQREAVDRLHAAALRGARPVLAMPTGAGKTVVAAHFIREVLEVPDARVLFIAHRRELITQAQDRLAALGVESGRIMADDDADPDQRVQVASVQTLARRQLPSADVVIVDEAHHAVGDSYAAVLGAYNQAIAQPDDREPRVAPTSAAIIGLTATPYRLDGRGLGEIFSEIVSVVTVADLCGDGTLIEPTYFSRSSPNLKGVRKRAGDFALDDIERRMNTAAVAGDAVREYQERAAGRRAVVFTITVDHAQNVAAAFQAAGIPAEHVSGETPKPERDAVLSRLTSGETLVVSNCMVLTEGWDLPQLDCAIILRPTTSLNLHLQMLGRIMRSADGKTGAVVLDHAGNVMRLGRVTRPIDFDLDGVRTNPSEPTGLFTCLACYAIVDASLDFCSVCGARLRPESETEKPSEWRGVDGDETRLHEIGPQPSPEELAAAWAEIEAEREAFGFREGWAAYRFKDRFGFWPIVTGPDRQLVTAASGEADRRVVYYDLLRWARDNGRKQGAAAHRYRETFGSFPPRLWLNQFMFQEATT